MTDIKEIKEELSGFKAILNRVLNFINPTKNIMVSSEEGETINFEGEAIEVGTKTVGDVPDGTYTIMYMEKKYTVTIAGNAVTEMVEVEVETPATDEPSETDKLQAEIDRLTAALEAANSAKNELETAKAQVAELTAVKTEFEKVKAQLSQIKSKHFNPDTNEWNFAGKFEDATKPKATVTETEMEQKVKEIKTKFKNK